MSSSVTAESPALRRPLASPAAAAVLRTVRVNFPVASMMRVRVTSWHDGARCSDAARTRENKNSTGSWLKGGQGNNGQQALVAKPRRAGSISQIPAQWLGTYGGWPPSSCLSHEVGQEPAQLIHVACQWGRHKYFAREHWRVGVSRSRHMCTWTALTNERLHRTMCCVKCFRGHEELLRPQHLGRFEPLVLGGPHVHGVLGADAVLSDNRPRSRQPTVIGRVVLQNVTTVPHQRHELLHPAQVGQGTCTQYARFACVLRAVVVILYGVAPVFACLRGRCGMSASWDHSASCLAPTTRACSAGSRGLPQRPAATVINHHRGRGCT